MRIHVVLERFAIVLVRPNLPSNLGAVARAAKNLGVTDLRVVEPAAPADEEAHRLASGADDVLSAARRCEAAAVLEISTFQSSRAFSRRSVRRRESPSCSGRRRAGSSWKSSRWL